MLKEPKRIIAEEPQSPDRWLKEPRNNQIATIAKNITAIDSLFTIVTYFLLSVN